MNEVEFSYRSVYPSVFGRVAYDFHLHDTCEIFFLLSGDVRFFVEKQVYDIKPGDIIITNHTEIHRPNFESNELYERYDIHFNQAYFSAFSTEDFDLLKCFYDRENGSYNKLLSTKAQHRRIVALFERYKELQEQNRPEYPIYASIFLTELLIILNKCRREEDELAYEKNMSKVLSGVLDYINDNIDKDLSLDMLEKKFFVSQSYLCRIFKKHTNSTIHKYIIKKRIALSKTMLGEGMSVTDTAQKCGFNDFSNFIKSFKANTGMSPTEYKRLIMK